jgi:nucleotide-binding universal stress UspA family protein
MARAKKARNLLYIVAFDGSPQSKKASDLATDIGNKTGAEVRIVTVEDLEVLRREFGASPATVRLQEKARQGAESLVDRERARVARAGVATSAHVLTKGPPADETVKYAEDQEADLIVTGSRGRTGIQRILLGSVASRIVQLAHCPVLVVR